MSEIAMDGIVALGKARQLINGVATGISRCDYDAVNQSLKFICNDGTSLVVPLPYPLSSAEIAMIHLLKIVGDDLEFDGVPLTNIVFDTKNNFDGNPNKLYCDITESKLYRFNGSSYVLVGGGSGSDGSAELSNAITSNVEVGGVPSGTNFAKGTNLEEIITKMLVKYFPPTATFSITPSTTVYESGNTVSSIKFTISATKKSDSIQSIKVYDGSTLLTTITNGVASGGTFTYTYSCNITSNTTLKVEVSDGTSTVSATKSITFANKSYYGFVADGTTVNETVIKALQNNVLKTSKALNYTGITCVDSKIVYAYPQSQGLLSSILDGSGFDYIDSYDCTNITVDGVSYNVYVMIDPTTLDDFTQKFA